MQIDLSLPLGRIMVLDIETAPDPTAASIAKRADVATAKGGALHRLVGLSFLEATEGADGAWSGLDLTSAVGEEADMLIAVDEALSKIGVGEGLLVTYNGRSHDTAVIRRRAAANWMFSLDGIRRLRGVAHLDLMRDGLRNPGDGWISLRAACAAYGIPTNDKLVRLGQDIARPIRKSQVDVAATFLLLLFETAMARGSENTLVSGWRALADRVGEPNLRAPHLDQFRWHPMLKIAEADRDGS